MRTALFVLAAAVVAGAIYFYFSRPADIRNYPSAGTDLIAIGDSLVAGVGAPTGQDFVSVLSQKIGQPIKNLGRSGDTTADVLERIEEIDAYTPKVVIVLVGGNDYLRRIDREETFANLAKIITNLQNRGAVVLLLGIRGGVLVDNFESHFESLRDTYKTAYVSDVLDGLIGNREYMSDQIHPNEVGYARIAERVYPELVKLIK